MHPIKPHLHSLLKEPQYLPSMTHHSLFVWGGREIGGGGKERRRRRRGEKREKEEREKGNTSK